MRLALTSVFFFLLLSDKSEDLFILTFEQCHCGTNKSYPHWNAKTFFVLQESKEIASMESQCRVRPSLFLPWVMNVFVWDVGYLSFTFSHYDWQDKLPCSFRHWILADSSVVLPGEGSCSHPAIATQAVPGEQGTRWFRPFSCNSLIFLMLLRLEQQNAEQNLLLAYKKGLGILSPQDCLGNTAAPTVLE